MAKNETDSYKAAEACRIAEVAPYVLRYWETEFAVLSEGKDKGASRLYSSRDVKIIARIRGLLYDEGFTVAGAKKRLEAEIAEGRFEDGGRPASAPAEQKKAKEGTPLPELDLPKFLTESPAPAKLSPAPLPPPSAAFPERKKVVKELKEIARILDPSKRR